MLNEILIEQNQLKHTGVFARPLLDLWGDGKTVLRGLYGAFSPHGATISGIRNESTSLSPSDQVIAVSLGERGVHRLRIDRTETTIVNFTEDNLRAFPAIVDASDRWLREVSPSFAFGSHVFAYAGHGKPREASTEEVLKT